MIMFACITLQYLRKDAEELIMFVAFKERKRGSWKTGKKTFLGGGHLNINYLKY